MLISHDILSSSVVFFSVPLASNSYSDLWNEKEREVQEYTAQVERGIQPTYRPLDHPVYPENPKPKPIPTTPISSKRKRSSKTSKRKENYRSIGSGSSSSESSPGSASSFESEKERRRKKKNKGRKERERERKGKGKGREKEEKREDEPDHVDKEANPFLDEGGGGVASFSREAEAFKEVSDASELSGHLQVVTWEASQRLTRILPTPILSTIPPLLSVSRTQEPFPRKRSQRTSSPSLTLPARPQA